MNVSIFNKIRFVEILSHILGIALFNIFYHFPLINLN